MPQIPEMVIPSNGSTIAFTIIVAFIAIAFVAGVWQGGAIEQTSATRKKWGALALVGILVWLFLGAVIPMLEILEREMMPPPVMIFVLTCFVMTLLVAFSSFGTRLSKLPFVVLVSFHAFRVPLEAILHNWYETGTLPVQMTWSGHNFDVATGIMAIIVGLWGIVGTVPRAVIWGFNVVGSLFLAIVISIALTSAPIPLRQYMNDPPVLLAYYFPYSWIVSIAVSGAFLGHIVLFRKLLTKDSHRQD